MNSWLKQWKSQVIIWVCVKLLFCPSPVHSVAALMSERYAWGKKAMEVNLAYSPSTEVGEDGTACWSSLLGIGSTSNEKLVGRISTPPT